MPFYDHEAILKATDGGLDIILFLCPDAKNCIGNNKHFKLRDENTPSTSLKQMPDGNWVATDWGASGKAGDANKMNAILLWQHIKGVDYKTALEQIALKWGIMPEEQLKEARKPDFNKRAATPEEKEGAYDFKLYKLEDIPKGWIDVLGPFANLENMAKYHWHGVKEYSLVKNRSVFTWASKENYPIFIIQEKGFKKIYQPLAYEKKDRFRYAVEEGGKKTDFLHGLTQAQAWYNEANPWMADGYSQTEENANEDREEQKIPALFICSGDRDALNVAGLGIKGVGQWVVWKNSESAKISTKDYKAMKKIAEQVYNIPDLDNTGVNEGLKLALFYLEIHTVELPEELKEKKDWRGNPRKDVTDFCEVYRDKAPSMFKSLLRVSYPLKFWDSYINARQKMQYEVRDTYLLNFLARCGFFFYKMEGVKDDFIYIKVEDNIVKPVTAVEVKRFVTHFLKEKREDVRLRDYFLKAPRLNPSGLTDLHEKELDFKYYNKEGRLFFFKNGIYKVTAQGIEKQKPGTVKQYVWEENLIQHKLDVDPQYFKVKHSVDENGKLQIEDIEIKNNECEFFKYLIQTSRIHWKKELEDELEGKPKKERLEYLEKHRFSIDGPNLSDEEIHEQKLHLVNKMYVIGYMLHRYKDMSRPWVPIAMDNRISDSGKSFGGSGKSILFNVGLKSLCKSEFIGAKKQKLFDNDFLFGNVTKYTDFVLFDDTNEFFDFEQLYPYSTGDFNVNPKNGKPFVIKFSESPKLAMTTNFALRNITPSSRRRALFLVFSDYYHEAGEGGYREDRSPRSEFGHNMLDEHTSPEEFNRFYNFMLQCLQMYLQMPGKLNPPMSQVELRNLRSRMGDTFFYWAEVYFSREGDNLNKELVKKQVMDDYKEEAGGKFVLTPQTFKDKLEAYCMYSDLIYNPDPTDPATNRYIRKIDGKTTEMIVIGTENFTAETTAENESDSESKIDFHEISKNF
ncbi:primase-helicase family protein [Roseivirga seohaensis]|uniref:primase-helicase family protein n=1 Tax=Roseivirga seohaensis TaxID=1914963 RepID=UPI003BA97BEA